MTRERLINLTFLLGLGLLSSGLWLVAPWLCLTVIGTLLLALSIIGSLMNADHSDQAE